MARVKHNARRNLGACPVDVVLVAGKKRHLLGRGRKQLPAAGMRPRYEAITERRGGTQRQVQRRFGPNEAASLKKHIHIGEAHIDMNTGRDDRGAVGMLDVGVVGIVGV